MQQQRYRLDIPLACDRNYLPCWDRLQTRGVPAPCLRDRARTRNGEASCRARWSSWGSLLASPAAAATPGGLSMKYWMQSEILHVGCTPPLPEVKNKGGGGVGDSKPSNTKNRFQNTLVLRKKYEVAGNIKSENYRTSARPMALARRTSFSRRSCASKLSHISWSVSVVPGALVAWPKRSMQWILQDLAHRRD